MWYCMHIAHVPIIFFNVFQFGNMYVHFRLNTVVFEDKGVINIQIYKREKVQIDRYIDR